jgi:hypothetical protein
MAGNWVETAEGALLDEGSLKGAVGQLSVSDVNIEGSWVYFIIPVLNTSRLFGVQMLGL